MSYSFLHERGDDVEYSSWLDKESASMFVSEYQRRFCVLTKSDHSIRYFKSESDRKPAGILNTWDFVSVEPQTHDTDCKVFVITENGKERQYVFQASTNEIMLDWIHHIKAVNNLNEEARAKSKNVASVSVIENAKLQQQGPLESFRPVFNDDDMRSEVMTTKEKTIDEMKIKTMFRMIEDVPVEVDGVELEKKVLYLTNKQCSMFDEEGTDRCIQALDLGQPKCIIRLIGSYGTAQDYRVHIQRRDRPEGQYKGQSLEFGSEIHAEDSYTTQKQLVVFFKNCLLPLAKKTKALIILSCADDCALTGALERVVLPELDRLGANCPFKILGWGQAHKYLYKSVKQEGLCGKLSNSSEAWNSRLDQMTSLFSSVDAGELDRCDLTKCCTHYIIFEGVDFIGRSAEESKNNGPSSRFKNMFLSVITAVLPSIVIVTTGNINYNYENVASLTRRNIPTLLLDSRQRSFTCSEKK